MELRTWEKEIEDQKIKIFLVPVLEDNYSYIVTWGKEALVVDPGEATPILNLIAKEELNLKAILNTHHHSDHIGGNDEIKEKYGVNVIGPSDIHIESVDQVVSDGEEIILGPLLIQVIATPGHTLDHICFYIPDFGLLFAGDLLFVGGCGKVFEGTFSAMYQSILKVAALPDDTAIFCGHDYTLSNLKFALSVDPDNQEIKHKMEQITTSNEPSIPSTLELEKKINPFLRCSDKMIRKTLGMESEEDAQVFCKLREMKNQFSG